MVKPEPFPWNDPLNEPENPAVADTLPVTPKEPEIIADPVNGNGEIYPVR